VVGDNPRLDAGARKRRAGLFNRCGRLAQRLGMQFCCYAYFREFALLGDTSGYNIMLRRCDTIPLDIISPSFHCLRNPA